MGDVVPPSAAVMTIAALVTPTLFILGSAFLTDGLSLIE